MSKHQLRKKSTKVKKVRDPKRSQSPEIFVSESAYVNLAEDLEAMSSDSYRKEIAHARASKKRFTPKQIKDELNIHD